MVWLTEKGGSACLDFSFADARSPRWPSSPLCAPTRRGPTSPSPKTSCRRSSRSPPRCRPRRTSRFLGTSREGSGIVIDGNGLVLTIGYLILESASAEIVTDGGKTSPAHYIAYDHASGLGLLRADKPLGVKPLEMGDSKTLRERQQVLVASYGGKGAAIGAYVVSRRDFAGYWEYMLDNAIFTAPPHPRFGGAALIDADGRLMGVGSLIVPNAAAEANLPGNMFVPVNRLKPILADLLEKGRSSEPSRPWLGLYPEEVRGRLFVNRVPPGGPAASAGIVPGDLVLAVADKPVTGLTDYYRKLWSLGEAGVVVPLTVLRGMETTPMRIKSIDRYDWFRLRPSY